MTQQMTFSEAKKAHMKNLKLYVPVVERVHGKEHPEFYQVRKLYDQLVDQIKEAGRRKPQLEETFKQLRETTSGYEVPGDVCESYEAVYRMLQDLDRAYHG